MQSKSKWFIRGLYLVVFALLVATFFDSTYRWNNFENYSENLVSGRVFAEINGFPIDSTFGLGRLTVEDSPCDNDYSAYYQYPDHYGITDREKIQKATENFSEYSSQIGLQGHLFGFAARILKHPKTWLIFRIANISALIIILMLISGQLAKRYGTLMGMCFLGVSVLSPWVRSFAPNLYWVEFTWFVPMLLGILCLNMPKQKLLWYVLFFLSILIKCLCGFEYLSTILVGAVLFPAAEWICYKDRRKKLFRVILTLGLLSVVAFLVVYIFTAMTKNPNLSIGEAITCFYSTNVARRLQGNDPNDIATTISPLKVVVLYFWENLSGKAMLLLTACTGLMFFLQKKFFGEINLFQLALFLLSLCGTLSWFVLAKQHSYIHLHLNFVLWFIGTAQIETYIIADGLWSHRDLFIAKDTTPKDNAYE